MPWVLSAVGVGKAQPPPPVFSLPAQVRAEAEANNDNGNDGEQPTADQVDAEKQAANAVTSEPGVTGIQAAQAIWGKHGRWLIITGYVLNYHLTKGNTDANATKSRLCLIMVL